ncbi:MAG: CoA-transferase [Bacillota bacterium]|nr:CoA-transferase [Bacillota bacterium]
MKNDYFSMRELMAVAGSRELKDHQNVLVGLGLPQVASILAQMTHAPNLTMILEIGVIDPEPKEPSVGIADPRIWFKSSYFTNTIGTMGNFLHRGLVDVGFIGGLEIDMYGNLNSTLVNRSDGGFRHFTGSGGANDIATLAKKILVIMPHEKRKFPEKVTYNTSTGFLNGGTSRSDAGLKGGGPAKIITDKAIMGFNEESKRMELLSVHPGVRIEDVVENTGFELLMNRVDETAPPSEEEIELLREVIDPARIYIK